MNPIILWLNSKTTRNNSNNQIKSDLIKKMTRIQIQHNSSNSYFYFIKRRNPWRFILFLCLILNVYLIIFEIRHLGWLAGCSRQKLLRYSGVVFWIQVLVEHMNLPKWTLSSSCLPSPHLNRVFQLNSDCPINS